MVPCRHHRCWRRRFAYRHASATYGIPYKIFEASDRPAGRIYTYQFASKPPENPQGKHDYYGVGAMLFPDNDANKETFRLFDELGLSSKKIEYVFSINEDIHYYNGEC
jgi:hypothetical protein